MATSLHVKNCHVITATGVPIPADVKCTDQICRNS